MNYRSDAYVSTIHFTQKSHAKLQRKVKEQKEEITVLQQLLSCEQSSASETTPDRFVLDMHRRKSEFSPDGPNSPPLFKSQRSDPVH